MHAVDSECAIQETRRFLGFRFEAASFGQLRSQNDLESGPVALCILSLLLFGSAFTRRRRPRVRSPCESRSQKLHTQEPERPREPASDAARRSARGRRLHALLRSHFRILPPLSVPPPAQEPRHRVNVSVFGNPSLDLCAFKNRNPTLTLIQRQLREPHHDPRVALHERALVDHAPRAADASR